MDSDAAAGNPGSLRDIIVVGGSAGSVDPLLRLASRLPADLPAAVFVVLHIAASSKGELAGMLARIGALPSALAEDGEPISPGRIYVARPDHHLLIENGKVAVAQGPKENRARPAIDPLFRSASAAYGPRVIGVILSGMLDDGAQGLAAVKRAGGIAIVQHPKEARFPSMPMNAMLAAEPEYTVPAGELPALLSRLSREPAGQAPPVDPAHREEARNLEDVLLPERAMHELGRPSVFSCPDCGGVLFEIEDSGITRFRCSIGHAYGAQSLVEGKDAAVEEALAASLRALQESERLSLKVTENLPPGDFPITRQEMQAKAASLRRHAGVIQTLLAGLGAPPGKEGEAADNDGA